MNTKMIRYILAKMLGVEALLLLLPALVGVIYQEKYAVYFLIPSITLLLIFVIWGRKKPENSTIYGDRKSTRLNTSHATLSRMPSSA